MAFSRSPAIGLALTLLLLPSIGSAAEPNAASTPPPTAPAATVPAATVPLSNVVMFSSGVGFFDRQGEVDGDASVALKFNAGDINDLLKSLVLEDRGGGQISAVTYGSKDPITKTLNKFAVDLTSNPTLGPDSQSNPRRADRVHRSRRDGRHAVGRRNTQARNRHES